MKRRLMNLYLLLTLISYIFISGLVIYLYVNMKNLQDDKDDLTAEVQEKDDKIEELENKLDSSVNSNTSDDDEDTKDTDSNDEDTTNDESMDLDSMTDSEIKSAIISFYKSSEKQSLTTGDITIKSTENSYLLAIIKNVPTLLHFDGDTVDEIIYSQNDAPSCSKIDDLGVTTILKKCLDEDGKIRDTK